MALVKRLGLALGGALFAALVMEAALGAFGEQRGWPIWRDPPWSVADARLRYRLRPGRHTEFGGSYTVGPEGVRGRFAPNAKILVLGDSTTFGVGVRDEQPYAVLLSTRPGEVVNAGVPGFNSLQGERYWASPPLSALRPKAVFLMFGSNDIRLSSAPDRAFFVLRKLAAYSRLATALLRLEQALWREEPEWRRLAWTPAVGRRAYKAALKRMAARARALGAVPFFVTSPWDVAQLTEGRGCAPCHADYMAAMREAAAESGTALVDLAVEFEAMEPSRKAQEFMDHAHFTALGHAHAAKRLKPWAACALAGGCPPR